MIHEVPAYLKKPITLRLLCRGCKKQALHHCVAVGAKSGEWQHVKTTCLRCERSVTK